MARHVRLPLLVLLAAGSLMLLGAAPAPTTDAVGDVAPDVSPGPGEHPATAGAAEAAPDVATSDVATSDRAVTGEPAPPASAAQASQDALEGLFRIDPGQCDDGGVTSGSYFRMVTPVGSPDSGPYVQNTDSPCGDDSYTPLRPGTDGGLVTGEHQPHPDPAFDGGGNALADRITRPESFFGTEFSTATNPTDPQTGADVAAPEVATDGAGGVDGDLRSFAAAWNGQHFNQGAPKPDGSRPGNTAGPTGSYDPATGRYTLEWSSHIQGGPFNGFTGVWHLEGTFEPAAAEAATGDETGEEAAVRDRAEDEPRSGAGEDDDAGADELPRTGPTASVTLGPLLLGAAALLARRRRSRR